MIDDFKDREGIWVKSFKVVNIAYETSAYSRWVSMNSRCKSGGSKQGRSPQYIGCVVGDNFKDFQFFVNWYTHQVGYGIDGYAVDKDILFHGNKTYSEHTCALVPEALNSFLVFCDAKRGAWPLGVGYDSKRGKFRSYISRDRKLIHLGYYNTPEEAHLAYKTAKEAEAYRWYERLRDGEFVVDPRVIERMRTWKLETV